MASTDTTVVLSTSFAFASALLVVGHILRARIWVLRRIYLPSSLIGGLIGLAVVQVLENIPATSNVSDEKSFVRSQMLAGWTSLPAFLIAIVFSCLFMGSRIPGPRKVWQLAGPQLVYGQILAWGQYAIPIFVTATVLSRDDVFGSNELLGAVIALGFEGGHGTAAAVADTFDNLDYPEGKDLALCAATIGLLSGLLFGTALVNWAVSKKLVVMDANGEDGSVQGAGTLFSGVYAPEDRPISGRQTVSVESLDSLAFHISLVGIALLIGTIFKRLLIVLQGTNDFLEETEFFDAFPLFPFAMFGGIIIQIMVDNYARDGYIDRGTMERISGFALDFTVVTAITTMRLDSLADEIPAFLILVGITWLWHLVCFFFIAPAILPDFWVERSLAELGQSMGITATGLLLLRMVDPDNKTPALTAFSYKQLLHEPIVGGGIWTALVLPFIKNVGVWPAFGVSAGAVVFWFLVHFVVFRKKRKSDDPEGVLLIPDRLSPSY